MNWPALLFSIHHTWSVFGRRYFLHICVHLPLADDAVEAEQGGAVQEGSLPSAGPCSEHEKTGSLLTAGDIAEKHYIAGSGFLWDGFFLLNFVTFFNSDGSFWAKVLMISHQSWKSDKVQRKKSVPENSLQRFEAHWRCFPGSAGQHPELFSQHNRQCYQEILKKGDCSSIA